MAIRAPIPTPERPQSVAVYNDTQTLQSIAFPDLGVVVADFFRL